MFALFWGEGACPPLGCEAAPEKRERCALQRGASPLTTGQVYATRLSGNPPRHKVAHIIESRRRRMPWRDQRINKRFILSRDLHLQRARVGVPLWLGARPDNRRTDRRVVQHPGNGELDNPHAAPLGVLLDLLGDAQGFNAPFGFQDALVLAPGTAAGFRCHVWCILPLSTPRASG